ncbi:MAG: ferrous iron transporter B [Planctomycetes bacterium]|nr:ferrous iron transporter B [Planctomycetota bacterium]NOG53901.1 ferrous iron transporter B [Planctomycetota bacterium]
MAQCSTCPGCAGGGGDATTNDGAWGGWVDRSDCDAVVALAGNPNTGKSSVFNALTGMRQHTGNWPGKTVTRAEGMYRHGGKRYLLVDLPGTYSLLSASQDEEVARDFVLFGQPDCTVAVVDATCLERNLNLVLQILEISRNVVVCVNLMDEAESRGIDVDLEALAEALGVPVVGTSARTGRGISQLISVVADVISGEAETAPTPAQSEGPAQRAISELAAMIRLALPDQPSPRWIATRLLDGDHNVEMAITGGRWTNPTIGGRELPDADSSVTESAQQILTTAQRLRADVGEHLRDELVSTLYAHASAIAERCVTVRTDGAAGNVRRWDRALDRVLTSPVFGVPVMLVLLGVVFWLTVTGANAPSSFLAAMLIEDGGVAGWLQEWVGIENAPGWLGHSGYTLLHDLMSLIHMPAMISGFLVDGVYLAVAWVVAVMLPPMAIFFPLFTLLEDLGYLPRVAFNLDWLFRRAGAHGKQALTMSMGFGCNAAGVVACRIIESPRERLIAIITNNFVPCNGRFPTLILISSWFIAGSTMAPGEGSEGGGRLVSFISGSLVAAGSVSLVVLLGVLLTLAFSFVLSRTVLKGEASAFTLELPPYRRPSILRVIYTSILDRTLFVLARACLVAAPAGAVIWILANVMWDGHPLSLIIADALDPLGWLMGVDGVVLLAYLIAIPANEIVMPTLFMVYAQQGRMIEMDEAQGLMLLQSHGWSSMTAICLMLFCLIHNPCGTTIWTIWKETRSAKWTAVATFVPVVGGVIVCSLVAGVIRAVQLLLGT